jgi:two-component system sensor histidine kinase MprB
LVDNAIKFDPTGVAPIEIVIRGGRVEVNDRGPGVANDDLPRIFDRFHRAVSSRSRPGSGLGLSIVQDIATRHGGTVFAINRHGGGSSIGVVLPPIEPAAAAPNE